MSKKAISTIGLIVLTVLSTSIAWMPSAHYEVSDGYAIDFKSKDPSGSFKTMDGSVEFDEANIDATQFNLKIDVKSISTGNGMMNKKSQTAEWFDATKFPFAKFKSTKVVKKGTDLSKDQYFTVFNSKTKNMGLGILPAGKSKIMASQA